MNEKIDNDMNSTSGGVTLGSGRKKSVNNNEIFIQVKSLMDKGIPKYIACKKLKITRSAFDRNLSFEQKRILDEYLTAFQWVLLKMNFSV